MSILVWGPLLPAGTFNSHIRFRSSSSRELIATSFMAMIIGLASGTAALLLAASSLPFPSSCLASFGKSSKVSTDNQRPLSTSLTKT